MIKESSESIVLKKFKRDITVGNCTILFGASVSIIPPTGLPSGQELKDLLVDTICMSRKTKRFITQLKQNKHYQNIVPEVLFQELYSIIREKLFQPYELLRLANFNCIHQFLAWALNRYNTPLYTTNFDLLTDRFLQSGKFVYHLHGSISDFFGNGHSDHPDR